MEIALKNGGVALIDDEDFELVSQYEWRWLGPEGNRYAVATYVVELNGIKYKKLISMHRLVTKCTDPNLRVDHIYGKTLDNRKSELRVCTPLENARNRTRHSSNNTNGYRGIYFDATYHGTKKWKAQISLGSRRKHVGRFDTAEQAARAFDEAAKKHYGSYYGKLNFNN
jgi:hypothetical protein